MRPTIYLRSALTLRAALVAAPVVIAACSRTTTSAGKGAPTEPSLAAAAAAEQSSSAGLRWGPAPAVFQPGATMAVVQGDPSKAGETFIVRLRFPSGYEIAPHTHPTDENVTVLAGTFKVGMGSTFDETQMATLQPGAVVTAPALHAHYAKAIGATTVQVSAIGPFALTYVNPADLPKAAQR